MINKFVTKHRITLYRLALELDIPHTTMQRWSRKGPKYQKLMRMGLKQLARKLRKEQ